MTDASQPARPSFRELVRTFGHIGLINFGGPAGQIALMHRVLVDEKRWIEETPYLQALNFCTLLPGPEAQQLATYVGWKLHGWKGGLAAGLLFIVPGALVVLALTVLYAYAAHLSWVETAFLGVKAAVLAIVVEALIRVSKRALNAPVKWLVAGVAFIALVLRAPFPVVIALAALVGFVLGQLRPELLGPAASHGARPSPLRGGVGGGGAEDASSGAPRSRNGVTPTPNPLPARGRGLFELRTQLQRSVGTILLWAAVWAAPLALAAAVLGPDHVLVEIGLFFSKLAVVTFGGAYAVLAYLAQHAVEAQWLKPGEMVDGLGLAETTPGPLILVTEYVGFLAAFRAPAPFAPLLAGVLGALMTVWVTFAPCFLWIFAAAPYVERLQKARRIQGALAMITAAVVGVIGSLALWFGLHVLFASFAPAQLGPLSLELPRWESLSPLPLGLTGAAVILLFGFKRGVVTTLVVCALLALVLSALGWTR